MKLILYLCKKKMENICKYCGKIVFKKSIYCDVNCMTLDYRSNKIKSYCLTCNKEIENPKSKIRKYCSNKCYQISTRGKLRPEQSKMMIGNKFNVGKKFTIEQRLKISGENNHRYKGYKCDFNYLKAQIRKLQEYKDWRINVFKRDLFTCKMCGNKNIRLECHHIIGYSEIVKKNNIKIMADAINCLQMWDVNNGLTLCKSCHKKTDNYAKNTN